MKVLASAWCIHIENFRNRDEDYYFTSYELAKESFNNLAEQFENYPEFYYNEESNYMEWFDSSYNEYSTVASLYLEGFAAFENPMTEF